MSSRESVHDAIQASASLNDDLEGGVLVGWITVAEWMAPSGEKWLSVIAGDARGQDPPPWQTQGYLHHVLNDWGDDD